MRIRDLDPLSPELLVVLSRRRWLRFSPSAFFPFALMRKRAFFPSYALSLAACLDGEEAISVSLSLTHAHRLI